MNKAACQYYTETAVGWMLNNKVIVILSVLSFCLFVSMLAMMGQKNSAEAALSECQSSLTSTTESTATTPATTTVVSTGEETTVVPSETSGRKRRSLRARGCMPRAYFTEPTNQSAKGPHMRESAAVK